MDPATSTSELFTDETSQVSLPRSSLRRTWGLGTMATVLCGLLAASGLALMFFYKPVPALASLSLLDLEATSSFAFLRGVHFWGSRVLVMVVWLHLFRAVVREAYRPPHHRGWFWGVGLLLLTLTLARTGSLLPSEQATNSGAEALLTIYVLHCAILPVIFFAGIAWHLWQHLWQTRDKGREDS